MVSDSEVIHSSKVPTNDYRQCQMNPNGEGTPVWAYPFVSISSDGLLW